MGEVVEQAVSKASMDALKKQDVRPAQQPKISITSFDEGKDLEFDISLEIYPEVPKVDYKKISLKKWTVEISEKDIQEGLVRFERAVAKVVGADVSFK
jgi:trigger factor